MKNKILISSAEIFFCISTAILLLLVISNAFYAHPMADDHCFSVKMEGYINISDMVLNEYLTWGGRYSTFAFISIFVQYFDLIKDFWILSIFLILLSLSSLYYFFSAFKYLGCADKDWRLWTAFSWIFFLATISAMPEVLYWLSGGITYAGGYGILFIVAGLLLRLYFAEYVQKKFILLSVLTFLLVILTPGFNEVAATLQVVFLIFGIYFTKGSPLRVRLVWSVSLFLAIVALLLSALAPGNIARMGVLGSHSEKWVTPFYGLYEGIGVLLASIVLMYLVTSNSFVLPVLQRLVRPWLIRISMLTSVEKIVAVLFVVALYSAVFMPSYWAEGGSPAKRTETILYVLPVLIWVPYLALINAHPRAMRFLYYPWVVKYRITSNIISCLAIILIFGSFNVKNIVYDAFVRSAAYDQQLNARYKMIDEARNEGRLDLVVPALTVIPKSLFFGDILTDAGHWRNTCYAEYFKLNSIKLDSETVNP